MASLALALVAITAIGWFDWVTGDVAMSLVYLLPVVAAAWWAGRAAAAITALAAGVAWFVADVALRPPDHLALSAWNGVTRLVTFGLVGMLIARSRRDARQLAALNASSNELYRREVELARTDSLTGMPNARAFRDALDAALARARRNGTPLALAYVDLDGFKQVNDRLGHAAGDDVLRRVAGALQDAVRAGDVAARLGGDEFAVLLDGAAPDAARGVGDRILDRVGAIAATYPETSLGASIGIACFATPPDSADAAIRRADELMYLVKAAGKGQVAVGGA